jgi:small subunit ribosomal protein S6
MRYYELMVIFPMEEDQHQAGREHLLSSFSANQVEIVKTDELGDKDLAYEIKKRQRGRYVLYTIRMDPTKIAVLDRIMKLNSNLLKHLFVRIDGLPQNQ